MTPKEKAKELFDRFRKEFNWVECDYPIDLYRDIMQCALIAVDEIINSEPRYPSNVDWDDCGATHQYYYEAQMEEALNYWQEVKQEIEDI